MPALQVKRADPALLVAVTDHEVFQQKKREEFTLRDISCKAICAVKHALRQPGAQADGRPAIPEKWNEVFKPQLGSFMKFVLGRPDQFRVVEGSGPGFYTVENVAGNRTVVAPSMDQKGKGKGKSWGGGKAWGGADAKGTGKDFGKGKFGKGKFGGKGFKGGKDTVPAPVATTPAKVLPMSARLLAQVAKEELAAEKLEEEEAGVAPVGEEVAEEQEAEDHEMEAEVDEEAAAEAEAETAFADDVDDEDEPAGRKHGNLIGSLLLTGKRKRVA